MKTDEAAEMVYVYFIQAGKKGAIKIGVARNIQRRIDSMQTGNAYRLNLLCSIPCETKAEALALESRLHGFFKSQKVRGEWFQGNINVKKAIRRFERKAGVDTNTDKYLNQPQVEQLEIAAEASKYI